MHIKSRKRVRFADDGRLQVLKHKLDISSKSCNAHALINEPKTSEYKSFRKIIEETATKSHANQQCNQDARMLEIEAKKEKYSAAPSGRGDEHSPFHIELTPSRHGNYNLQTKCQESTGISFSGGLFHQKRCKILKSAAEAFSIEFDELTSKCHDFIPKFLQRLGTNTMINNDMPQRDAQSNSALKRIGGTRLFCDASYPDNQPNDFEELGKCDVILNTSIPYGRKDIPRSRRNQVRHIVPFWDRNVEKCFTRQFSGENLRSPNKSAFSIGFEKRNSETEMKMGCEEDHEDSAFHPIPSTDSHFQYQKRRDLVVDFGSRDLYELDSSLGPSFDLSLSSYLSVGTSDSYFDNKQHGGFLSQFNIVDEPHFQTGIIPCQGYSLGQSLGTCQLSKLLEDYKYYSAKENFKYEDQSDLKLLGWKENTMNEVFETSKSVMERNSTQLPLALYQNHDPYDIAGNDRMGRFSLESRRDYAYWLGDCSESFQYDGCPSLDDGLVNSPSNLQIRCRNLPLDLIRDQHVDFFSSVYHNRWTSEICNFIKDTDNYSSKTNEFF